jgi:predicted nucleotidyltransferase
MIRAVALDALGASMREFPGVVSAYVFGSVNEGRAHRQSDVDIGVLLDRSAHPTAADRFDARLRLIARFEDALRRAVDLVILNDAPPHLVRHIMTTGRRVVVFDAELDHQHLTTALSRAADLEPFLRRMRTIKLEALSR